MATQEERLTTLERSIAVLNATFSEITHNETMLLGMAVKQEEIIREVHARLAAFTDRLTTFEQGISSRFETQQRMIESLEQHVNSRFEGLEHRFETLEQSINSRFEAQEKRLDEHTNLLNQHTNLLTQILARLPEKP